MSWQRAVRIAIYLIMFAVSFWALSGLDMAKVLRKGQVGKANVMLLLSAMALGYLSAELLLALAGL